MGWVECAMKFAFAYKEYKKTKARIKNMVKACQLLANYANHCWAVRWVSSKLDF